MKTLILATIISFVAIRLGIWIIMILLALKSGVFKSDNVKEATREALEGPMDWAINNYKKIHAGIWIIIGVAAAFNWKIATGIFIGTMISSLLATNKISRESKEEDN